MSNASDPEIINLEVGEQNVRIDKFLSEHIAALSRSRLQNIVRQGGVQVNSLVVSNPSSKVVQGDVIQIILPEPEPAEPEAEDIPLDIFYEDAHLIVINKKAGMVVHPGPGNWTGTMVNALIHHCGSSLSGIGGVKRPGIVHRLDKDTSGLLVVAKTDPAHQALSAQFADHGRTNQLERQYKVFVWGKPMRPHAEVVTDIARSPQNRLKMAVAPEGRGKLAITHYKTDKSFQIIREETGEAIGLSLLTCQLETGRTHQIRVHMAHIGHPILRDPVYGQHYSSKEKILPDNLLQTLSNLNRQALHAGVLQFEHPETGEVIRFESPLPEDMQHLYSALEQG